MFVSLVLAAVVSADARTPGDYPTVCRVRVPLGGGSSGLGSGCCVYSQAQPAKSYVLTASHVVKGGQGASCVFPDGKTYQAKVAFNNSQQDVAVLVFDDVRPSFTPISKELPARGDPLTFVGYGGHPRSYFLAYAGPMTGTLGSHMGAGNDTIEARVPSISQGDSGGAVLYKSRLVAVISAKDDHGHGIATAVCYARAASWIERQK